MRIDKWNPVEFNRNILESWVMDIFEKLAEGAPFGDGRITLALAFDLYFIGQEVVTDVFSKAKALGVKTITPHFTESAMMPKSSTPQMLANYGLPDESMLFFHASNCSSKDAELIRKEHAHISSTPSTELQMVQGAPRVLKRRLAGLCV